MTTIPSLANPFIGPRSFETGERLFGRDREVRDLLHLLVAERIVLLYSPSGAGKSSLIKAALIPALERKDFVALPPVRVNQELPPHAPPGANRYVYSTLLSLEERFAPEERLDQATLAAFSLASYLQQRLLPPIRAVDRDPVLLFDQFEEVLTADPTNIDAKQTFFTQLGEALGSRHLWALFAMREDYVAAMDPYLAPIPNRFKDTFRLDLLGVDAARQAMQGPAKAAGALFSTMAARRLIDDLRRTRVQRPDGRSEEVLGPHVEPVQLQVVCLRLWEQRFTSGAVRRKPVITPDDISDVGDVQQQRSNKRIRLALIAVGVAALVAVGLAAYAFRQSNIAIEASTKAKQEEQRAEQETRLAQLRALAAQSLSDQDQAPERSLLLAVATQQISVSDSLYSSVGLNALLQGLQRIGGRPLRAHTGRVTKLAFSRNGTTLITSGEDGTVRLWRLNALDTPPIILRGHQAAVTTLALSPDGRTLATGSKDTTARLWRLDTPAAPRPFCAVTKPQSGRWPSARTAAPSPPAATTAPPASGIWTIQTPPRTFCGVTQSGSGRWPSAQTAAPSQQAATTKRSASGAWTR